MVILNYLGEIWKDIPDFEGQYQGSNYGRIKSLNYDKERILKTKKDKGGYLIVCLSKNGVKKYYLVHRLIWMIFNGAIPEGYEINHKDENKSNNRLDNLELVTHKENNNYGTRTERAAKALSKPVFQYNLNGDLVNVFPSANEVERQTGYSNGNISLCCSGKRKSAYGYIWKYK